MSKRGGLRTSTVFACGLWGGISLAWLGCTLTIQPPPANENDNASEFANTTDPFNKGAEYIGASACRQCHSDIADEHSVHGHAHKLTAVQGEPPAFPEAATRAGVPTPPEGFEWADIAYVIGGYIRKARFIDNDGYVLTDGRIGTNAQWNVDFPPNGTTAGFVAYEAEVVDPKPYDFSCFYCHTTGPQPQNEDFPEFQENRPGFIGTWAESGIQCEACHGPGDRHFATVDGQVQIDTSSIYVSETGADTCDKCHTRNADPSTIPAKGGYLMHREQRNELTASGGHAGFACTVCHNPHVSVNYDRDNAIRNECSACHADQNMAKHEGKVLTRGDYTEALTCESCHMPFATKSAAAAKAEVVGDVGRMGDEKTHIFRIDTEHTSFTAMFNDDGTQVAKDAQGRAAVTLDFVCYRCHNGVGTFSIEPEFLMDIARNIHATSGS